MWILRGILMGIAAEYIWYLLGAAVLLIAFVLVWCKIDSVKYSKMTEEEKQIYNVSRVIYENTGLKLNNIVVKDRKSENIFHTFDFITTYTVEINESFDEEQLLKEKMDDGGFFFASKGEKANEYSISYGCC